MPPFEDHCWLNDNDHRTVLLAEVQSKFLILSNKSIVLGHFQEAPMGGNIEASGSRGVEEKQQEVTQRGETVR